MTHIDKHEIRYLQARRRDDVGDIFEWNGRILRGIWPRSSALVADFFDSGFIRELIHENVFPNSWITEYSSEDYSLIVEHQRISPIVLPQEWSFNMLRDAALVVLRVARIARKYGYNMKDCHGLNILFENNQPKFVDLGSFHRNREGVGGWEPYEEFLRFYYYPLRTWKDGLEHISKLSIFSGNLTPHSEHYLYRYKALRCLSNKALDRLIRLFFMPSRLALCDNNQLYDKTVRSHAAIRFIAKAAKQHLNAMRLTESQDLESLEKIIEKIRRRITETAWTDYHSRIAAKKQRFGELIRLVNKYCADARSAIDIGGNQGLFSSKVLEETGIESIICQDLDEEAVDLGYCRHKSSAKKLVFANYNSMAPIVKTSHPLLYERFKSDIVFACALLHHLILCQGFSLDYVLEELARYSSRYVCVEFMPKGLWTYEDGDKVSVPDWYTVDWFKETFFDYFHLLGEQRIAENYIVFIGAKK
jgi:hypothetical protein